MTTALSIITGALQEIGAYGPGDALSADDAQTCLSALNVLADQWLTAPNYAYRSTMVSASLGAATASLTIGASQSLNTARPIRIEQPGSYITTGGVDYPLMVVTREQYNSLALKNITGGWPSVCFYDPGTPTGTVYFWPLGACTVNLMVLVQLSQFADLSTDYSLPPGYANAFTLTLMEEVVDRFRGRLSPLQMRRAAGARRMIKRSNFKVPQLDVPGAHSGIESELGVPRIY